MPVSVYGPPGQSVEHNIPAFLRLGTKVLTRT
jgi:hypothetical protein